MIIVIYSHSRIIHFPRSHIKAYKKLFSQNIISMILHNIPNHSYLSYAPPRNQEYPALSYIHKQYIIPAMVLNSSYLPVMWYVLDALLACTFRRLWHPSHVLLWSGPLSDWARVGGSKRRAKRACWQGEHRKRRPPHSMMTSWHGNSFHITVPLWGESTGDRWIPLTKDL